MSGGNSSPILEKEQQFPGLGAQSTFWAFMVVLGTVMALVDVAFCIC